MRTATLFIGSIFFALISACAACQRALYRPNVFVQIGVASTIAIILSLAGSFMIDPRFVLATVLSVFSWLVLAGLASVKQSTQARSASRTH